MQSQEDRAKQMLLTNFNAREQHVLVTTECGRQRSTTQWKTARGQKQQELYFIITCSSVPTSETECLSLFNQLYFLITIILYFLIFKLSHFTKYFTLKKLKLLCDIFNSKFIGCGRACYLTKFKVYPHLLLEENSVGLSYVD